LIRKFADRTGIPVVLNTSFNLKGDPIVNTIKDAVQTFYTSGLDSLIIGPFCVDKGAHPESNGEVAHGGAYELEEQQVSLTPT